MDGETYQAFMQASSHAANSPSWQAREDAVQLAVNEEADLDVNVAENLPEVDTASVGLHALATIERDALQKEKVTLLQRHKASVAKRSIKRLPAGNHAI